MRRSSCAVAFLLAACSSGQTVSLGVQRTTRGDTAVVRSRTPDQLPVLGLVEELRLGNASPDAPNAFERIADIAVDRQGRIAVFDRGRKALLLFHPDGSLIGQVGRQGAGPGEYQDASVGWVTFTTDGGLAVWDGEAHRLVRYDSLGRPTLTIPVTQGAGGISSISSAPDGGVLLRHGRSGEEEVVAIGADGTIGASRPVPVAGPVDQLAAGPDGAFSEPLPFGRRSLVALTPSGDFVGGNSGTYAITVGGAHPVRIEREATGAEVATGERTFWEEEMVAYFRQLEPTWSWRGPTIPRRKAFFTALLPGLDGSLLVRVARPGVEHPNPDAGLPEKQGQRKQPASYWTEPVVWERFDSTGALTGELRLPERARLRAASGDRIWVVVPDSMDVPWVIRYRIRR